LAIGIVWLALTLAFEFFIGLVFMKRSLTQVVADYDLPAGPVGVFFLVWLVVAPWLFFRFQSNS
jgi:hypothetical protein